MDSRSEQPHLINISLAVRVCVCVRACVLHSHISAATTFFHFPFDYHRFSS